MTCIKMGSDESHFNVSLIVRDKVTRQCPQTTTFEEKGDKAVSNRGPSAYQPTAFFFSIRVNATRVTRPFNLKM